MLESQYNSKLPINKKGFTLIEAMVGMVIVAVLATALSVAMMDTRKRTDNITTSLVTLQDDNDIMRRIEQDFTGASLYYQPIAGEYRVWAPSQIIYTKVGDELRRTESSTEVLSRKVTYFDIFCKTHMLGTNNYIKEVQVKLDITNDDGSTRRLQKTIRLLNSIYKHPSSL